MSDLLQSTQVLSYRVIQKDWSTGSWWVLVSSFLELFSISLMVRTQRQDFNFSPLCSSIISNWVAQTAAIPLNKQLYTLSYLCVTSGAAALVFSVFYIMVQLYRPTLLFLKFIIINLQYIAFGWNFYILSPFLFFGLVRFFVIFPLNQFSIYRHQSISGRYLGS